MDDQIITQAQAPVREKLVSVGLANLASCFLLGENSRNTPENLQFQIEIEGKRWYLWVLYFTKKGNQMWLRNDMGENMPAFVKFLVMWKGAAEK